jgi:hypothetical protein
VDNEVGGHGLVDLGEELLELVGPVTSPDGGNHLSGGRVERS